MITSDNDFYFRVGNSSRKNRKAPIFIGTRSGRFIKVDLHLIVKQYDFTDQIAKRSKKR